MPCNCKPHFHNRTYVLQATILKNFPSSSQSLSSQKPKIRLFDNIMLTFVSLWLYVSHCEGERERELKPDIAEPCFSFTFINNLPLELAQSGTFSFLNRPTQWRWWRWLRAIVTLFLFLMPCHLRCQKNIRAWTALKVLSSIKPQMFQSC